MEAGAQSALLIIWVLFWMLALSLLIVHPMFRPTRVQIRRSLRLSLHRRRAAQARLRGRTLRIQGFLNIRLGKGLLWLAECLEKGVSPPRPIRFLMGLLGNLVYCYVFIHLIFRETLTWQYVLAFLAITYAFEGVKTWWKRRKQRIQETTSGADPAVKPSAEQRAEQ